MLTKVESNRGKLILVLACAKLAVMPGCC